MKVKLNEFTQLDQLVLNQANIPFTVEWTDDEDEDLSCELTIDDEYKADLIKTYAYAHHDDFEINGFVGQYRASNFFRRNWKLVHDFVKSMISEGIFENTEDFLAHLKRIHDMDVTMSEFFEAYFDKDTPIENKDGEFMRDFMLEKVAIFVAQSTFGKIVAPIDEE